MKKEKVEPVKTETSLEMARRLSARNNEGISDEYRQEAEVYVAWLMGEIDTSAVAKVLGVTHPSTISAKAGTVLRNCAQAKALKIVWVDKP